MVVLSRIDFRPVDIQHGKQFIDLMNRQYSRKKPTGYFNWQYFDTPLRSIVIGAFINEKIVGGFGLQCRKLSNGLTGGQAIDLIVDEEFRGQGLFSGMGKKAMEFVRGSIDFCFSFPNSSGEKALSGSLGFRNVVTVRTLALSKDKMAEWDRQNRTDSKEGHPFIYGNSKASDRLYFQREEAELNWRFKGNPEYNYSVVDFSIFITEYS